MKASPSLPMPGGAAPDSFPGSEFRASFLQESLWVSQQVASGSAAYHMPEAWLLRGRLDLRALEAALSDLVDRHEPLRTSFRQTPAGLRQHVHRRAEPGVLPNRSWPILDFVDLAGAPRPLDTAREFVRDAARRPFNLETALLFRAQVCRVGEEEHLLLLLVHHLVADAWSWEILLSDLAAFYEQHTAGLSCGLPPLGIQYADFSEWQRDLEAGGGFSASIAFWRRALGELSPQRLLHDYASRSQGPQKGGALVCEPGLALASGIDQWSRQARVTPFSVWFAALAVLLSRYLRQEKVIIGTPFAGRDAQTEGLVGYFANLHALPLTVAPEISFKELALNAQAGLLDAAAHQEVTYQQVVQTLPGREGSSLAPVFSTVLAAQPSLPGRWTLPGLEATRLDVDLGAAKFDLTIILRSTPGSGPHLTFEYSREAFEETSVHGFARLFLDLVPRLLEQSTQPQGQVALAGPAEQQRLLTEWSRVATVYERDASIPQVFEAQVLRRPEAPAIRFGTNSWSYAELDRLATRVAARLQGMGFQPGATAGLCLPRSPELPAAILGVLKAGGCYLPLDPAYPAERLGLMVKESAATVVIARTTREAAAFAPPGIPVLSLCEAGAQDRCNPIVVGPQDAAYVMFTSGSTGRPKAVRVPHRAVLRLVRHTNYMDFRPEDVFLLHSSPSFDASTFELWGGLLNGACVVLPEAEHLSLRELGRIVRDQSVTVLWLTAGLFHQMIEDQLDALRRLRCLLAGGEALSPAHVARAARELTGCALINGYGPTENTTFTTCYRVPAGWEERPRVPIGKPIANTRVYVLDDAFRPLPPGVPGHLFAAGDGLALGYANDPQLTAARFVPDPFENEGERMYRTGDLARWRPDGELEFLGREDAQLKVRGFRVEPGEVETALRQCPGVREACVAAVEDGSGSSQLVACVVPSAAGLGPEAVRSALARQLPAHAVPSRIALVDRLPLNANGKVDRQKLLRDLPDPQALRVLVNPRTETERAVFEIWQEVLGRNAFGVDDSFFQLGGHSLLATRVMARIHRRLGRDLPLSAIFEWPTIGGLAALIDASVRGPELPRQLPPGPAADPAGLLARIEELSDAEVEALLQDPGLELKAS